MSAPPANAAGSVTAVSDETQTVIPLPPVDTTPPLDLRHPEQGQRLTATRASALTNTGGTAITLSQVILAGRPPGVTSPLPLRPSCY